MAGQNWDLWRWGSFAEPGKLNQTVLKIFRTRSEGLKFGNALSSHCHVFLDYSATHMVLSPATTLGKLWSPERSAFGRYRQILPAD